MRLSLAAAVVIAVIGAASPSPAQVLEAPARGGLPPDTTSRPHAEVSAQANLLGGFDDNLAPGDSGDTFEERGSGYTGFADASVRYWYGTVERSVDVNSRAFLTSYRGVGIGPAYGGDVNANGRTSLGRRTSVNFTAGLQYDPYFSLGAFGSLTPELGTASPDQNTSNAVTEDRSWSTSSSASLTHNWTRRLSSDFAYTHTRMTFVEGSNFDTRTHQASAQIGHTVWRGGQIVGSYTYMDNNYILLDGSRLPMTNEQMDLGYQHTRQLSRTRALTFSAGAGTSRIQTLDNDTRAPIEYWSPSGYGTLRYDFGRTWNISGDYRRTVSVLQGLTPEFFNSDSATIRTGGALASRLTTVFVFGYVNGQAGDTTDGRYDGYTGSGQLRIQLSRNWSSGIVFNHYQYQLNPQASVSLGVTPEMHRSSVMAGFNWTLPPVGGPRPVRN